MSAQPTEDEHPEGLGEPRFTITYRKDGREVTVDLDEVPDEQLPEPVRRWQPAQARARVEDIRFMADHGETLAGVAERLTRLKGERVTPDSVERFLYRYGAHAVVWQLKAAQEGLPAPDSPDWHLEGTVTSHPGTCRSEGEVEESRRRWVKGPQNSGTEPSGYYSVRRVHARRPQPLRGMKL